LYITSRVVYSLDIVSIIIITVIIALV